MLNRKCLLVILLVLSIGHSGCYAPVRHPLGSSTARDSSALEQLLASLEVEQIQQHVVELTSESYAGRAVGTEGERLAAAYLIERLAEQQLEPWYELGLEELSYDFTLPGTDIIGRNVVAVRKGKTNNWLLLVSHYDHLGVQEGQIYPGADDNAVAVAVLLETARCFSSLPQGSDDNVAFIYTSGEERHLSGSKDLAGKLVANGMAQRCRVVNLDMLGGTGGNSLDIWREPSRPSGKQLAARAMQAIQVSGLKSRAVKRRFAGVDSRSFAQVGVPSITLSWAYQAHYHPYRHQPTDTIDRLKPEVMEQAATGVMHVLWALSNTSE